MYVVSYFFNDLLDSRYFTISTSFLLNIDSRLNFKAWKFGVLQKCANETKRDYIKQLRTSWCDDAKEDRRLHFAPSPFDDGPFVTFFKNSDGKESESDKSLFEKLQLRVWLFEHVQVLKISICWTDF